MKQWYSPQEAAEKLTELHHKKITVSRLGQLRRAGKIHGVVLGYNNTLYSLEDLLQADVSLDKVGRKPITEEQIAACTRVEVKNCSHYSVHSLEDNTTYQVYFTRHGWLCSCKKQVCWHMKAAHRKAIIDKSIQAEELRKLEDQLPTILNC